MRVQSLASLSGLRIWSCCKLGIDHSCSSDSIPGWELPYATGVPCKEKEKKKKRKKEKKFTGMGASGLVNSAAQQYHQRLRFFSLFYHPHGIGFDLGLVLPLSQIEDRSSRHWAWRPEEEVCLFLFSFFKAKTLPLVILPKFFLPSPCHN